MKPINVLLLGAGSRGTYVYADYGKQNPAMLKVVAVADPDAAKREKIQKEHGIPSEFAFQSWEKACDRLPPQTDGVVIATQDQMHLEPILTAMKHNLHILCEKPIVPRLEECRQIEKAVKGYPKVFMIAHVLKYTAFFSKIKKLLAEGKIGRLIGIDLIENVGHLHISHSFIRGNWNNSKESSPMILAKSCHDMDIMYWLAGSPCESLFSYGDLHYFKKENAPQGAPSRCLEGCPVSTECPYFAPKIYLTDFTGWPVNVISTDLSLGGRLAALETGPYGRCVFRCDNNVVDHQNVAMRFTNGVTANFIMTGFSKEIHRSVCLFGTAGEIKGDMEENKITVNEFSSGNTDVIEPGNQTGGHSGGDGRFITDFVNMARDGSGDDRNMIRNSFESHYMAFAAEQSRLEGKTVKLDSLR
jgi:predicted dehydrogenase